MSEVNQQDRELKKDSHKPDPLKIGRIKYIILKLGMGVFVLGAFSAIWWWPRSVEPDGEGKSKSILRQEMANDLNRVSENDHANMAIDERIKKLEKQLNLVNQTIQMSLENARAHNLDSGDNAAQNSAKHLNENAESLEKVKVDTLLALFKVRDALEYGYSFESMVDYLKNQSIWVRGIDASLAKLDEISKIGSPTLEQLKEKLEVVHSSGFTWLDLLHAKSLMQKIQSMVRFEKVDGAKIDSSMVEGKIHAHLEMNDVEGALKLIESLESTRKAHYDDWIRDAQTYRDVRNALDNIMAHVIAQSTFGPSMNIQNTDSDHLPTGTGVAE